MAKILYRHDQSEHVFRKQLIACDPSQLQILCVPLQTNQGVLGFGSFIDLDGNRALIATQVAGVLASTVDMDSLPASEPERFGTLRAISDEAIGSGARFNNPAAGCRA